MGNLGRQPRAVITACLATLITANVVAAQEMERESLKGLKGVQVLVELLRPDVEGRGVSKDSIKTDVELRLRQSGIKVYANSREDRSLAKAYLYINLNSMAGTANTTGLFAACIEVHLNQWMRSQVNGQELKGSTWSLGMVVTIGVNNLRELRDDVMDLVDVFIYDYLAANPKQP